MRLEEAREEYDQLVIEFPREQSPIDWAHGQVNLGNVHSKLGQRMGNPDSRKRHFNEAVTAFTDALTVLDQADISQEENLGAWLNAKNSLGPVLAELGQLENAVKVFRAALEKLPRAKMPLYWASVQINLGNVLRIQAESEPILDSRKAILTKAKTTFQDALNELSIDKEPWLWADAQGGRGKVLAILSILNMSPTELCEAHLSLSMALEIVSIYRLQQEIQVFELALQNMKEQSPAKEFHHCLNSNAVILGRFREELKTKVSGSSLSSNLGQ